jgi:VanZ family protein
MRRLLVAGGWLYAAAIALVSLIPRPPQVALEHGDKLGHFAAYSLLSFWFCWLYPTWRSRIAYAAGWMAMGVALEFAQGATGYRSFEFADMAANTLGVLVGAAAALILPRDARGAGTGTR